MSVDAILHYYASQLEQKGIKYRYSVEVPEKMKISDLDICRIFGNLMENAVRAVQKEENADEAYVNCICKVKMGKLLINIENTYAGEVQRNGAAFYSTSHSGQGIGIASVSKTAEKYGGYADFSARNGIFRRMCLFHWKIWIYGFRTKPADRLRNFAGSFFHIKSLRNQLCRLLYYEKR